MQTVKRLNKEMGITVVLVTHFMDEAVQADRVIVMDSGRPVMDGTPAEVFTHAEELVAMGLNIPQVTQVFLRLREMGVAVNNVYTIDQAVAEIKRVRGGAAHA